MNSIELCLSSCIQPTSRPFNSSVIKFGISVEAQPWPANCSFIIILCSNLAATTYAKDKYSFLGASIAWPFTLDAPRNFIDDTTVSFVYFSSYCWSFSSKKASDCDSDSYLSWSLLQRSSNQRLIQSFWRWYCSSIACLRQAMISGYFQSSQCVSSEPITLECMPLRLKISWMLLQRLLVWLISFFTPLTSNLPEGRARASYALTISLEDTIFEMC